MKQIKKILVPIDFSAGSKKLLQYAAYFADKYNAVVSIVSVVEFPHTYSFYEFDPLDAVAKLKEDIIQYAHKQMETFVAENREQLAVSFECSLLTGRVAEEIVRYAEKEKVDLIIIGTHGYRGFDRMIFGSVAEKVIKTAPCPTLRINTYIHEKPGARG